MPNTSPARLLALGALVALALTAAACSSGSSSGSTTTLATSPATTSAGGGSSSSSTTSSTDAMGTTTTTSATAVQNLQVSPAVRATLTSTFVNYKAIPASDVSGTVPNSVYLAYDPTTKTTWALAQFSPSSTASQQTLVGFQDGGALGLFKMQAGGAWTVQTGGDAYACSESKYFPATVLAAWDIAQPTAAMQC